MYTLPSPPFTDYTHSTSKENTPNQNNNKKVNEWKPKQTNFVAKEAVSMQYKSRSTDTTITSQKVL